MNKRYVWDGRLQRYRDKATGKIVRQDVVVQVIEQVMDAKAKQLQEALNKLIAGKITLLDFQIQGKETIKYLHAQNYLVARGGFRQTQSSDYLAIGRSLKELHYVSFRRYIQDLNEGVLSEAQAKQRLNNFITAAKSQFHFGARQSAIDNGFRFARRILSPVAEHCPDCPIFAALGVVPIEEVILPGQQCQCVFNCKCTVEYTKENPLS